jgi:hypothetical protein
VGRFADPVVLEIGQPGEHPIVVRHNAAGIPGARHPGHKLIRVGVWVKAGFIFAVEKEPGQLGSIALAHLREKPIKVAGELRQVVTPGCGIIRVWYPPAPVKD